MIIDAHQHFWKLSRGDYDWPTPDLDPLYQDFAPDDLAPLLHENGVGGTIVVQATDTEAETEYLLSLADQHDWILGVVGWVDMEADTASQSIAGFAKHPKFVGIRPMMQGFEDDEWMLRPALAPAIKALIDHTLCFDALVLPKHLPHLAKFLQTYPDLRVVIDHCAKPEIRNRQFQPWAEQIKHIADNSNAFCKISGLVTEANSDWKDKDIIPYAEHVLNCFGPKRVMFGSDWPVLKLAGEYQGWLQLVQSVIDGYPQDQKACILYENAEKFYLANRKTISRNLHSRNGS